MRDAMHDSNQQIEIYQTKDGKTQIQVNLKEETVWLSQEQMCSLFERNKRTISEHIRNIFREKELPEDSVVRNFRTTAADGKQYNINYYNLDVIISVGYRVKSQRGTQFRIWATTILKQHLLEGYTLNQKRLEAERWKMQQLRAAIDMIGNISESRQLEADAATELIKIIRDYSYGLNLIDAYDHDTLEITGVSEKTPKPIAYNEAMKAVEKLKSQYRASDLFGKERDGSFQGSLAGIFQTFDESELYPSIEEKAANLLYFLVKNHPFIDGNKRIAAFIFLWFLERNKYLYRSDGSKRIADNALVALTLMVAESKPKEKDLIVKVIINLINSKN